MADENIDSENKIDLPFDDLEKLLFEMGNLSADIRSVLQVGTNEDLVELLERIEFFKKRKDELSKGDLIKSLSGILNGYSARTRGSKDWELIGRWDFHNGYEGWTENSVTGPAGGGTHKVENGTLIFSGSRVGGYMWIPLKLQVWFGHEYKIRAHVKTSQARGASVALDWYENHLLAETFIERQDEWLTREAEYKAPAGGFGQLVFHLSPAIANKNSTVETSIGWVEFLRKRYT